MQENEFDSTFCLFCPYSCRARFLGEHRTVCVGPRVLLFLFTVGAVVPLGSVTLPRARTGRSVTFVVVVRRTGPLYPNVPDKDSFDVWNQESRVLLVRIRGTSCRGER